MRYDKVYLTPGTNKTKTLVGEQVLSSTNKDNGMHMEITHCTGLQTYKSDLDISDIKILRKRQNRYIMRTSKTLKLKDMHKNKNLHTIK